MKKINIKLFGAFRNFVPSGQVSIPFEKPCTVQELKKQIHEHLKAHVNNYQDENLLAESAMATADEILDLDIVVNGDQDLALLPPVCGG